VALDLASVPTLGSAVAVGLLATVGAIGFSLARPRWLTAGYLGLLLLFGMVAYGALEQQSTPPIWSRGSGYLYFSLVMWGLLGLQAALVVIGAYKRAPAPHTALHGWFVAIIVLWVAHLGAAAVLGESLTNLVFGAVFFGVLLRAFDNRESVGRLIDLLLVVILLKGIYGLVRFVAFGGDPANIYANSNGLDIRLTYFEINESFLAILAAFIAAWTWLVRRGELTFGASVFYGSVVLVELLIVFFSYRRTAWGGLLLAALLFVAILPPGPRWKAMALGLPALLVGVVRAASQRLEDEVSTRGWFAAFFDDVGAGSVFAAVGPREIELRLGMDAFVNSPLVGNGTWARFYDGYINIPWQRGPEAFLWLHSSVLHLAFKTGVLGLGLVAAMLVTFVVWVVRNQKAIPLASRGVYFAGLAGVLFYIPSFAYGPAIIEYRTTQLFFFALALPFLVHRTMGQSK
jgi:hypothetical protein